MSANNDIAGLRRDPETEALAARMDALDWSSERQLEELRSYFTNKAK